MFLGWIFFIVYKKCAFTGFSLLVDEEETYELTCTNDVIICLDSDFVSISQHSENEVEDKEPYKDDQLEDMEPHKSVILHLLSQLKLGMDLTRVK